MTDDWRPISDPRRLPANDTRPEDLTQAYHRMRADLEAVACLSAAVDGIADRAEVHVRLMRHRDEHETAMLERMERDDWAGSGRK